MEDEIKACFLLKDANKPLIKKIDIRTYIWVLYFNYMKTIIYLLLAFSFVFAFSQTDSSAPVYVMYCQDSVYLTEISYELCIDLGDVPDSQTLSFTYPIKNIGAYPLELCIIKTSSGCVVAEWDRTPVAPQDSLIITFYFDTKGKRGNNTKTATVWGNFNGGEPIFLRFKCNVVTY